MNIIFAYSCEVFVDHVMHLLLSDFNRLYRCCFVSWSGILYLKWFGTLSFLFKIFPDILYLGCDLCVFGVHLFQKICYLRY